MTRTPSQSARLARTRGADFEREVVNLSKAMGLDAERIKGSGAHAKGHKDVRIDDKLVECKRRRNFKQLYSWLEGADLLAIRGDNKEALAVLPLRKLLEMMK